MSRVFLNSLLTLSQICGIMCITLWSNRQSLNRMLYFNFYYNNEVTDLAEITRSQQPITNPALVEAMDAMKAERNPVTESRFVNTLKAARFLVPANITSSQKAVQNEDGTVELKDTPNVAFVLFNNPDQKKFFPLFTDEGEFQKWEGSKEHQRAAVSFVDLCRFLQANNANGEIAGAVINPFGANIMVPADQLIRMMNTEAIAPGTKIQIGTLKEEPTELLDALREFFGGQEDVEKAYLRVMKREDKQNPNFLLVVDIDVKKLGDTGVRQLFDAIAQAAKPHLRGVELAIVPTAQNFGQAALKDAVPFYEK